MPLCEKEGIGQIVWSPDRPGRAHRQVPARPAAAGGLPGHRPDRRRRHDRPAHERRRARPRCRSSSRSPPTLGLTMAQLAVAWVLQNPNVSSAHRRRHPARAGPRQRQGGGREARRRGDARRSTRCSARSSSATRPRRRQPAEAPVAIRASDNPLSAVPLRRVLRAPAHSGRSDIPEYSTRSSSSSVTCSTPFRAGHASSRRSTTRRPPGWRTAHGAASGRSSPLRARPRNATARPCSTLLLTSLPVTTSPVADAVVRTGSAEPIRSDGIRSRCLRSHCIRSHGI